tara:strand:+ start:1673 stop:2632 length:960 start_codon:yes stop_codon:yes gene_type:complete
MNTEIKYETEGRSDRARMRGYHGSPSPRDLSKGAKNADIAGLKSASKRNLMVIGDYPNVCVDTKFRIGMEIEKSRLHRGAVKEYALLAGFETDSSCGYEAITNILPLLPSGKWRNKVFNMMFEARRVIEDRYSPSSSSCGGHITISVEGMNGEDLHNAISKNCGIIFSLFRKRLSNGYCRGNMTMLPSETAGLMMGGSNRYRAVRVKGDCVEFRLPSRFQSVKQMMRRYELMYELLDFSINNPNGNHSAFLKRVAPIVKSMYAGDEAKTNEIIELSKSFRKMILTNKINREVLEFVDPMGRLNADLWYDRELLRNGYRG